MDKKTLNQVKKSLSADVALRVKVFAKRKKMSIDDAIIFLVKKVLIPFKED